MTADRRLAGIYPILYAFFTADGRLDEAAMRRQARACVDAGAHGLAVLGLVTEVAKLTRDERLAVVAWTVAEARGRVPVAVTVAEDTVADQIAMVRAAAEAGAAWVILQPPRTGDRSEAGLVRFFGAVADAAPVPMAIQNAPEYLGVGLGPEAVAELNRNHPNFRLLKGEGPALLIKRTIEQCGGRLAVFNGRGGLELPDNLRAGCAGLIPAPDCFDRQVRIFELMATGDAAAEEEAEAIYREILPLITFLMQSIDTCLCYGKRLTARRLGLDGEVHERDPAMAPTAFGLASLARYGASLGPFP